MKKTVTVLLGAALCVAAASCAEGPQKRNDRMETKNSLTEQEKAAGILTAEVMWKMGRVGGSVRVARRAHRALYGDPLRYGAE